MLKDDRVLLSNLKSNNRSRIKKFFSIVKLPSLSAEKLEMNENIAETVQPHLVNKLYENVHKNLIQVPATMINVTITSIDESEIVSNVTTKITSENVDESKTTLRSGFKKGIETEVETLRARERLIRDQRLRNDRSINTMLITVSITFLALTFPYQIVWIADQINKVVINYQLKQNFDEDKFNSFFIKKIWLHQLVFYTIKDISLTIRNLNFSINFFLYSTMSNLFRKELNFLFQKIGFYNFHLFRNSVSFADKVDFTGPISKFKNRTTQINSSN